MAEARSSSWDARPTLAAVRDWGEARDWHGWDPYDGLLSPASGALTLGTGLGRRLLAQAVKRSPVNLRPLLRIPQAWNQKAIGLVASGYVALAACGDDDARSAAERWLRWLETEHAPGEPGGWGYHFPVETRFFRYAAGSPNTIATSFVADALLDAVELLADDRRRDTASKAAEFLVREMLVTGEQGAFFRYVPGDGKLIHNANLLAAAVLLRLARNGGDPSFRAIGEQAVHTSLMAQRDDGSWPYSDWGGQGWVDNFHTGYVLASLAQAWDVIGVQEALARGVDYWETRLFLPTGEPKYYPDRPYPLDAHCYAQAIDTWLAVPVASGLERAERMAALLARDMIAADGSVVFQRGRFVTNRVPFIRWTTAPVFRALARLVHRQHVEAS